ncbi:putative MPP superfamily phosphohydrolase [Rhodoblastus acidophilus]|uniref:metallophosphoesterase n=1 Tax=Rhodoblastus acidophilus TaxID=1074 RepID=UPI0022250D4D|nr:metallophosphoesterase [Rhodoblastus acidophilus]MCW2282753.1 putative MPP superfamily phosphohydrolase [Rhodoblastus acidophilus]MCW2331614.1 putative MPP superfamily phosphohydrolase [Rhodoblastus acidophilus]
MQIVHITDLHYKSDSPFQREIIESLFKDIDEQREHGFEANFLIFTGDLVNNPDDANIYNEFEQRFLIPLVAKLGVNNENVILCPGNHDVSRKTQNDKEMVYATLQGALKDQDKLFALIKKPELKQYAKDISSDFFKLASKYGGAWNNPFYAVHSFDSEKLSFVTFNSAFGCSLKGSEDDRGHLAICTEMATGAFQEVPKGHRIITLAHHSPYDMNESTTRHLDNTFDRYVDIHCYGHVHQSKPTAKISPSGKMFLAQGGALFERNGSYNGYSVIRVASVKDHFHIEARYRSYYANRNEFDEGLDVNKRGLFYNTQASDNYWKNIVPPPTQDDVCYLLMATQDAMCKPLEQTIVDKTLSETFVDPYLIRPHQGDEKIDSSISNIYRFSELLNASENIVIAADKEFGATSLIRYLYIQSYRTCAELPRARVPAIVDSRKLKSYEASITSTIRASIPDSNSPSLKLLPLHDAGRLLILIDDFDVANLEHMDSLKVMYSTYPKAKFIITAKLPLFKGDGLKPILGLEKFIYLQMQPLNRGRVRALIKRWKEPAGYTIDQAVEEIITRFDALGIPLTAAYVTIYLSILQEDKGFSPINTSTVLENFVEGVLNKYKPEYRFRNAFDYRDQINYLSYIAEMMCRENKFIVEYESLYGWTTKYFKDIGIEQDYTKIIEFFTNNKIFDCDGNSIMFRYNLFLSFFIATQMTYQCDFRDWVFSDKIYMSYMNEIDIYCGLKRNDTKALEFLGEKYAHYAAEVAKLIAPLAWTDRLETLKLPSVEKSGDEFSDQITHQLTSPNLSDETRDEVLDRKQNGDKIKPSLSRPDVDLQDLLGCWVITLRCYSVALKNLEGISVTKKEEHLDVILSGWATLLRYACLTFETLLSERQITIGPFHFELTIPKDVSGRLLRAMFLVIPLVVSNILRSDLGSQKLKTPLSKTVLNDDKPPKKKTEEYLRVGLYADMKLSEYMLQLKALRKSLAEDPPSPFLLESLLFKLRDIYLRYGMSQIEQKPFREIVTELSADLRGLKGDARSKHITEYLNKLEKDELVTKLRENRS